MLKKHIVAVGMIVISIFAYTVATFHDTDVVEKQRTVERDRQLHCLAQNIYHEARGESMTGQRAVALVTMNRVNHPNYPSTVCDVVYQAKLNQNGEPILHKCQFSWFCDGKSKFIRDEERWEQAMKIAAHVYDDYKCIKDVTAGAIMYHASYVLPYWKRYYTKTVKIESHIFYK